MPEASEEVVSMEDCLMTRSAGARNVYNSIANSSEASWRQSEGAGGLFFVLLVAVWSFGVFTGWCIWGSGG